MRGPIDSPASSFDHMNEMSSFTFLNQHVHCCYSMPCHAMPMMPYGTQTIPIIILYIKNKTIKFKFDMNLFDLINTIVNIVYYLCTKLLF